MASLLLIFRLFLVERMNICNFHTLQLPYEMSYRHNRISLVTLGRTQPPIQSVPEALSLGVKRPGREADHSPSSSAEVKNAWSYTCTPQYVSMAWCLVRHRDNFTFFTYFFYLT
jgi:hypothetical protein